MKTALKLLGAIILLGQIIPIAMASLGYVITGENFSHFYLCGVIIDICLLSIGLVCIAIYKLIDSL